MNDDTASPSIHLHVVGAAIIDRGRCLIAQRSSRMALPGKWEFPGGKVEDFEAPEDALAREIEEELGIRVIIRELLGRGSSNSGKLSVVLDVYAAEWLDGVPSPREHAALAWARANELAGYDWAEADIPIVPAVQRRLSEDSSN